MTSQLLRKRRTTLLSTFSGTFWRGSTLAGLAVLCGAATVSAVEPASSPLERLRARNPANRWEQLKNKVLNRQPAEQPALPVPQGDSAPFAPFAAETEFRPPEIGSEITPVSGERVNLVEAGYQNTTTDPSKLKKVTSILPYADYQPQMNIQTKDFDPNLQAPEEVALSAEGSGQRTMTPTCFQWRASNLSHNPLYFEDPALERYGHTHHPLVQPFASVGRFGVQLVGLPYQMTIDPPCKKMYPLGWYRPGDCAPKQFPNFPWNTKAAIVEGAAVTGAIFLFP